MECTSNQSCQANGKGTTTSFKETRWVACEPDHPIPGSRHGQGKRTDAGNAGRSLDFLADAPPTPRPRGIRAQSSSRA